MNNIPLVRIEIDHFRQALHHCFSEHLLKMDDMFQRAVDEACSPERVQCLMNEAAQKYLSEAINYETKAFFNYGGEGRKLVKEKVLAELQKEFNPQPTEP